MSHTNYTFSPMEGALPRQQMILRNVASAKYGGDWHSMPHTHSYTELFYIVGGDGQFQIDGQIFPVQANQLVVVNPNIIHTEVSYEARPLEYIVLGIEGIELTLSGSEGGRYCFYSFPEGNDVLVCMRKVLQEMQERILRFICAHSTIKKEVLRELMMRPDQMASDCGSVLEGEEAVRYGLIDELGGLDRALELLRSMTGKKRTNTDKKENKNKTYSKKQAKRSETEERK